MQKTGETVANEVIMTRENYKGTIFVVEGDNDIKTLQKFAFDPDSMFIPAWGKENAVEATSVLDREDVRGILTVIDADFWHIDGCQSSSPNLLMTDEHDLEMMIIRSNSFISVIRDRASKRKLAKILIKHGVNDVREILLGRALYVGYLRKYSEMKNLHLCFKGLRFDRFIDRATLEIDINALVDRVLALSHNPAVNKPDLIGAIEGLITECSHDPFQICCGHDFIAILGIGLRKVLGNKLKQEASAEAVGSALRLSYDSEDFKRTRLYSDAKNWEEVNIEFTTFR